MKTAISVPDETFRRVDERAAALGMSRSEFYARAAERYLAELDDDNLVQRINDALDRAGVGPDDPETRELTRFNLARLAELTADDDW